jgi:hypothetical protein
MLCIFGELIGRIIEAYVDDIVVKSKKTGDLVPDLMTVFAKLREHGVKLNPEKCIFRVPRGMLLGFVMSECDIKANPEKISAITDMGPIQNLEGVHRVTGCLAVLSRFIAQLGEHNLLLYNLMKKSDHFAWSPEAQEAINSLKNMLKSLAPEPHVHHRGNPGGQCCAGSRVRRAWKITQGATPGSLCKRRTLRLEDSLLTNAKTRVCCLDDQAQAPPLLRCTPHHDGV